MDNQNIYGFYNNERIHCQVHPSVYMVKTPDFKSQLPTRELEPPNPTATISARLDRRQNCTGGFVDLWHGLEHHNDIHKVLNGTTELMDLENPMLCHSSVNRAEYRQYGERFCDPQRPSVHVIETALQKLQSAVTQSYWETGFVQKNREKLMLLNRVGMAMLWTTARPFLIVKANISTVA